MSSPNLYAVAAAARTKRLRVGAMGHIVSLHHPVRLLEEIALTDQLTGGRIEVGLVPGILPAYFEPFKVDFPNRREATLEFARFMKAAYAGDGHVTWDGPRIPYGDFDLSVMPVQRPHPPMWMETRDVPTLAVLCEGGTAHRLLPDVSQERSEEALRAVSCRLEGQRPSGHAEHRLSAPWSTSTRPIRRRSTSRWPMRATPIAGSFRIATTRKRSAASRSRRPSISPRAASRSRPRSR